MAWAACGKQIPAATAVTLRVRHSARPWPFSRGVEAGRDLPPGQVLKLGVQAGLVVLHGQDVVRVLFGDQELGVLALSMQSVGGDHGPGQVQRGKQRREPGDLIGLAIHLRLGKHGTGLLVCCRQQVDGLPLGAGVPGAAHRLAVHGHRPPLPLAWPGRRLAGCLQPGGQPGPHRGLQRGGIHRFQDLADGRLVRRPEAARQRVIADP